LAAPVAQPPQIRAKTGVNTTEKLRRGRNMPMR
jgi:hypothetical protein